jgi:ATP-dependent helicase HrpA
MKQLEKNLPGLSQAALNLRSLISPDSLKEDMLKAITDRAFIGDDEMPRSEQDFMIQKQRARTRLPAVTEAVSRITQRIAHEWQPLMSHLSSPNAATARLNREMNQQLAGLIYPGFLSDTPWDRLQYLPRYLQGMSMRLSKYPGNPERDGRHGPAIVGLWNQHQQRLEKHHKEGISDPNLAEFRWQIEELRISLFAQELKTPYPVSIKRLQKLWEKVLG